MRITDRRTAKVWLANGTGASVSFLIIPMEALVDFNDGRVLASDRTEKIVLPAMSYKTIDIPAGYRIGADQSLEFSCTKLGTTGLMSLSSIADKAESGDVIYNMISDCVRQGDIIDASITEPE